MKKSELEGMIREMVKEAVATEMSNAFRYIMKEQFMNFSNKGGMIKESSGNKEDYDAYPEIRRTNNVTPAAGPELNRQAFAANYRQMMDAELGIDSSSPMIPSTAIPTTSPDGRPINLKAVSPETLSAVTKNYSSFMKTLKK